MHRTRTYWLPWAALVSCKLVSWLSPSPRGKGMPGNFRNSSIDILLDPGCNTEIGRRLSVPCTYTWRINNNYSIHQIRQSSRLQGNTRTICHRCRAQHSSRHCRVEPLSSTQLYIAPNQHKHYHILGFYSSYIWLQRQGAREYHVSFHTVHAACQASVTKYFSVRPPSSILTQC